MSTSFRVAQAIGLTGAAWLSGNIAALSLISVPALSKSQLHDSVPPSTLAKQWRYTFESGKAQNPPIAATSAASFSYLAWTLRHSHVMSSRLFGLAAVLTIGIVPWTILMMSSTNNKLIAKTEEEIPGKGGAAVKDEEVEGLLKKWTTLNGVRSVFPLLGSAVALVAILG